MGLPCVNHFVNNGLKDLDQWHDGEVRRIDCDLIGRSLVDGVNEAPAREIAICPLFPLHGDQTVGQFAVEEQPIVVLERGLQLGISLRCRIQLRVRRVPQGGGIVLHKTMIAAPSQASMSLLPPWQAQCDSKSLKLCHFDKCGRKLAEILEPRIVFRNFTSWMMRRTVRHLMPDQISMR